MIRKSQESQRTPSHRNARKVFHILAGAAALALVGACTPTIDNRGNLPKKSQIQAVKPGVTTKAQVRRILGSPSSISAFNANIWYYISKREERFALLRRKTKDQQVVEIRFNNSGVVSGMRQYGMKDARNIKYVARTTPTRIKEPGFFESLYQTLLRGPVNRSRAREINNPRGR
jgi:outer membrane protein assembly factor BamE (lipoprotein component of BamABCDE complex)